MRSTRTIVGGRSSLIFITAAVIILVFLRTTSLFADSGCASLSTANAGELLSIPERNAPIFPLPTTVTCTWHNIESQLAGCRSRRIIIQDRMLDPGHRLIITRPNEFARPNKQQLSEVPDKRPWDSTWIYACVHERVKFVYAAGLHAGGSIEPVAAGKFIESDSYQNGNELVRYQKTLYWHPESGTYTDDPLIAPPPTRQERISCEDMENLKAARIIALATDGFYQYSHGFGLYDDGEFDVTLVADRMFGDRRRLLTVRRNHLKGAGVVDDQLVFACLSGSIRSVFQLEEVEVGDATEKKLVLYAAKPDPKHRFKLIQTILKYAWNAGLADYVLISVDSRPLPPWKLPMQTTP